MKANAEGGGEENGFAEGVNGVGSGLRELGRRSLARGTRLTLRSRDLRFGDPIQETQ